MARISLYRKGSNPAVDPVFLKKSSSYVHTLVSNGDADWWDKSDPSRGAILRSSRATYGEVSRIGMIAAGTMLSAWGVIQSGYAGPLVWQMPTKRDRLEVSV
jgi:hypothetical protein